MYWGKKETYKTFSVSIKKEIDKDGSKTDETITCKIKFIDSARFMDSSSSDLVDNLIEGINKIKCKDYGCFLEYKRVKGDLIIHKCLSYNKCYSKTLNEKLKKKFKNTFKFSNNDINKFILLLRKDVYPYEYMDDWENVMKQNYQNYQKEFVKNLK